MDLANRLIATLPSSLPGLYNPWTDICDRELDEQGHLARRERLARHLDCKPRFALIGEAPGYQGCRYSGVAFTSERLLMEGSIPRIGRLQARISNRPRPFSEPSATIVWGSLYKLQIAEQTILWNAVQLHPHRPDEPWSNRPLSPKELPLGAQALRILREAFPGAAFVAVGKRAEDALRALGIPIYGSVRHPANGGARAFFDGLAAISKST